MTDFYIEMFNEWIIEYVIYFIKNCNEDEDYFGEDDDKYDIHNLNDEVFEIILEQFTPAWDYCGLSDYFCMRQCRYWVDIPDDVGKVILQKNIDVFGEDDNEFIQELKTNGKKSLEAYAYSYLKNIGLENLKLKIKPHIDFL